MRPLRISFNITRSPDVTTAIILDTMAATLPFSLGALRSHAIFVPPASSSTDDGWEVVDSPQDDGIPAPKNSRIALRDKDIIVAFGKEIRMTSLTGPGWEINGGTVGGYKVSYSVVT